MKEKNKITKWHTNPINFELFLLKRQINHNAE